MKKPSEIFEGENSSLRKTFDEATQLTPFASRILSHGDRPLSEVSDELIQFVEERYKLRDVGDK